LLFRYRTYCLPSISISLYLTLITLRYISHSSSHFFLTVRRRPRSTLFPYTTLFRSSESTATRTAMLAMPSPAPRRTCPEIVSIRSEEHTSELQSRGHLVCRLLLEKKKRLDKA